MRIAGFNIIRKEEVGQGMQYHRLTEPAISSHNFVPMVVSLTVCVYLYNDTSARY